MNNEIWNKVGVFNYAICLWKNLINYYIFNDNARDVLNEIKNYLDSLYEIISYDSYINDYSNKVEIYIDYIKCIILYKKSKSVTEVLLDFNNKSIFDQILNRLKTKLNFNGVISRGRFFIDSYNIEEGFFLHSYYCKSDELIATVLAFINETLDEIDTKIIFKTQYADIEIINDDIIIYILEYQDVVYVSYRYKDEKIEDVKRLYNLLDAQYKNSENSELEDDSHIFYQLERVYNHTIDESINFIKGILINEYFVEKVVIKKSIYDNNNFILFFETLQIIVNSINDKTIIVLISPDKLLLKKFAQSLDEKVINYNEQLNFTVKKVITADDKNMTFKISKFNKSNLLYGL